VKVALLKVEVNVTGKTIIPPYGSKNSKILLIGEAPGKNEEIEGKPFVGWSGKILDSCLASVGLNREDIRIDNVIQERPPKNYIGKFIKFHGGKCSFMSQEYRQYEQALYERIKETKANVLVPLGNVALYALTRALEIKKRAGSILTSPYLDNRKVIPTIHPASVLRTPLDRRLIVWDLMRVKREADFPEVRRVKRNITIYPAFDQITSFLDKIYEKGIAFFDIEVINRELSCFALGYDEFNAMSIPLYSNGANYYSDPLSEVWILDKLADLLKSPEVTIVGHNLIFDLGFMFEKYGMVAENYDDTMIMQGILMPDYPKKLDFALRIYGDGEPYYKDDGKVYMKYGGCEATFLTYNAKDVLATAIAYKHQCKLLKKQGNVNLYKKHKQLIYPLIYQEKKGMRVDTQGLKDESDYLDRLVLREEGAFKEMVGHHVNPNSPKSLMKYFYGEKKIKTIYEKATGRPTTNEKALKTLLAQGHEEVRPLLTIRKLNTLNSKYFKVNLTDKQRLTTSVHPVGTKSLRFSTSKNLWEEGTNIQTMPHPFKLYPGTPQEHVISFKDFMTADKDHLLINMDLKQVENRIVAYMLYHLFDDSKMWDAFQSGIDVHKLTASDIFNKPIEEITTEDNTCPLGSGTFSERFWGKKANHGLNYRMGYKLFAYECELSYKEAKRIVDVYRKVSYPGLARYYTWVEQELRVKGFLENPFGFRRFFLDKRDLTSAYSWLPQSTAPGIINYHGLLPIFEDPYFKDVEYLNQVHDSLVLQMALNLGLSYIVKRLKKIKSNLERPIEWLGSALSVPVDVEVGFNLGNMYELDLTGDDVEEKLRDIIQTKLEAKHG